MPKLEVITVPHPTLRKRAKEVTAFDAELLAFVEDMTKTMREDDGVGLAAPQVNVSKRVIIIEYGSDENEAIPKTLYTVINPKIVKRSDEKVIGVEGCLSVPGLAGDVERDYAVTVKGQTKEGEPFKMKATGWLARIFQHEIDHLNGILFTDQADEVWEPEEEIADTV